MTWIEGLALIAFGSGCALWAWHQGRKHERSKRDWPFNQDVW